MAKKSRLNRLNRGGRKHVLSAKRNPIPSLESKALPDLPIVPAAEKRGIGERGLGFRNKLRTELIEEHCGDSASQTQLLLVD